MKNRKAVPFIAGCLLATGLLVWLIAESVTLRNNQEYIDKFCLEQGNTALYLFEEYGQGGERQTLSRAIASFGAFLNSYDKTTFFRSSEKILLHNIYAKITIKGEAIPREGYQQLARGLFNLVQQDESGAFLLDDLIEFNGQY